MADTTLELLGEQLGKGGVEIVVSGTGAVTGKDCYAVHFPVQTVVTNLDTGTNVTGTDSELHLTYPAGTTLYLNITAITISSGLALIYKNNTL
ncbi:MAG: hypothetical protein Unbinned176contig1000_12 [Prokaryotic dsDNA virus sp.]|nr:MAG: hypothetical protein Unbinned176contig1000_12 [Prokaryotic dsDNA virus sp.]|tara:strand:+ start:8195 stop:8473 length:279 start_codon:yes stop_codon:yes gene_type:complete